MADLLTRYPTLAKLSAAGRGHVRARLKKHEPRVDEALTEEIFQALGQQTVVVAGTEATTTVAPILAGHLASYALDRPGHPPFRDLHPRRPPSRREQRPEAGPVPLSLRLAPPLPFQGVLRPETRPGKRHNQAITSLARRRTDALFAMLRDGALRRVPTESQIPSSVALAA